MSQFNVLCVQKHCWPGSQPSPEYQIAIKSQTKLNNPRRWWLHRHRHMKIQQAFSYKPFFLEPPAPHSSATTQRELRRAQCWQGLVQSGWDLTVSWHLSLQASDKEDLSASCSRQDSHCSISGCTGTSLTQAQVPIF